MTSSTPLVLTIGVPQPELLLVFVLLLGVPALLVVGIALLAKKVGDDAGQYAELLERVDALEREVAELRDRRDAGQGTRRDDGSRERRDADAGAPPRDDE